jgi:hypothetical protein
MFAKQISVVRGQSVNLVETLRRCGTPSDLVARPLVTVVEVVEKEDGVVAQTKRSLLKVKQRIQTLSQSRPWFTSC